MKSFSDYKDEEALDVLADLLEPAVIIFGDKEVADYIRNGVRIKAVKNALKNHKKEVIEMMAALERVPVEEYHCNVLTLPMMLLQIFNDPELLSFFSQQGEGMILGASSGSATENTEEEASIS